MMKIAAVTDNGKTISAHFGRAINYLVLTVENGQIVAREQRDKASHQDFQHEGSHDHEHEHNVEQGRGFGRHSAEKHQRMFDSILDCEIVLARGMGQGAYQGLQEKGIRPILTDITDIDSAVQAIIDGSIEDRLERLH